ncbi:MAG: BatD family protein, partial [Thermodesulfobacteriota bacterium]|nr:BatD family protein [Thermodesulfobacteriota bacterium]
MVRVKIVIAGILLLLLANKTWALTLRATVDKTEATIQDQIMLTLSVEGVQNGATPQLPELPGFDWMSRGSSTRMQIINNQVTSGVDYRYVLVPKQVGTFEIGPATIEYKGKTIASNKITITIAAADSQPKTTKDIFVTTRVNNETPFVNEQIIYTLKFYRSIRIANASLENPSFEGFRVETLGK